MKKSVTICKKAGFECVEDLPRTAVGFSEKAVKTYRHSKRLSIVTTSNGEQRV